MRRKCLDSRPPAVVLGLNPNGLGIVKSLRRAGIDTIAVDRRPRSVIETHRWMSSRTRLCDKRLLPSHSTDAEVLALLLRLGAELDGRPPLIPSGDDFLQIVAGNRERLAPLFRFSVPPEQTLRLLLIKGAFYAKCRQWGVSIPRTLLYPSIDDVRRARTLRYPVIIKPDLRDAAWERRFDGTKVLHCTDLQAVEARLAEMAAAGIPAILQEQVLGDDSALLFSHGYITQDGRLAALWTGRKIRQHPARFGTSTLAESLWNERVAHESLRIVRNLGLVGYFNVEYKRDPRDGALLLMEVTSARTWYPHLLGTKVGVNIPEIWYRDLLGQSPAPGPISNTPDGVRWVDEYRDIVAALQAIQRRELTVSEWLRSYARVRSLALCSVRDPLPGLFVLLRLVRSTASALGLLDLLPKALTFAWVRAGRHHARVPEDSLSAGGAGGEQEVDELSGQFGRETVAIDDEGDASDGLHSDIGPAVPVSSRILPLEPVNHFTGNLSTR